VAVVSSMRHREDVRGDQGVLQEALGRLWTLGVEIDWRGYWGGERRRRRSLPTYPFERERYWIGDEPSPDGEPAAPAEVAEAPPRPAPVPADPVDAEVLAVWGELVGGSDASANFFDLGGNSLIAAQLASRLADAFDADLSVRLVFEHPTPAALAEAVRSALAAGTPR